jgi:hypothetical protein
MNAQKLSISPDANVQALQPRVANPSYLTLLGARSVIVPMNVPKKISGKRMAKPLRIG